jgi:hypothetical protein
MSNDNMNRLRAFLQNLEDAPEGVQEYLTTEMLHALASISTRATALLAVGAAMPVARLGAADSITVAFNASLKKQRDAGNEIPADVAFTAGNIAGAIDAAVVQLLEGHTHASLEAHMDLVQGHAMICRGLTGINSVPEDYDPEASNDDDDAETPPEAA